MKKSSKVIDRRKFIEKTSKVAVAPLLTPLVSSAAAIKLGEPQKKKYALVGTGVRGTLAWGKPIVQEYGDHLDLVALCDINMARLAHAKEVIGTTAPMYHSSEFEKMISQTQPDTVIITTTDCFHATYASKAMELGCDVLSEKPLVTEAQQGQEIVDMEKRTGKKITTTFNARFGSSTEEIMRIISSGKLGRVISAEYQEYLDVDHGASYFRRWHGKKRFSGSLLVHKASHHFDQMNWWLDSEPETVNAFGKVAFYGRNHSFRARNCRTCQFKAQCDFYWDINKYGSKDFYLKGENEDGYLRDGCVWDNDIDTYDTMTVEVKYANEVILSYSLNAYMPYEGQMIAFNCEQGRLEVRNYHRQPWEVDGAADFRITKSFKDTKAWTIPKSTGEHGGADKKLRDLLFLPNQSDTLNQVAGSRAGLMSSLIGIAAVQSIETNKQVRISDLVNFPLSWGW